MILPKNITVGLFDNDWMEVPESTGYRRQECIFKIVTNGDMVLENKYVIKYPAITSGSGYINIAIIFINNEPYKLGHLTSSLYYSPGITVSFEKGSLQLDNLIKDNFNEWYMKQVML